MITGLEDPQEEGMPAHSSILAWRIPVGRGAWRAAVHGVAKSQTRLSNYAQHIAQGHSEEVPRYISSVYHGFRKEEIIYTSHIY